MIDAFRFEFAPGSDTTLTAPVVALQIRAGAALAQLLLGLSNRGIFRPP